MGEVHSSQVNVVLICSHDVTKYEIPADFLFRFTTFRTVAELYIAKMKKHLVKSTAHLYGFLIR